MPPSSDQLAAEALVAVVGLFHAEPLTRREGREAEGLPKVWRDAVAEFLDAEAPKRFRAPAVPDQQKTYDRLSAGLDVREARDLVAEVAKPELAEAIRGVILRARGYLAQRWPHLTIETPLGDRVIPAGWTEMREAAALYSVVTEPANVLAELRMWTLSASQAEAFRTCYPTLFELLRSIIWDGLRSRRAKRATYNVPWKIERMLRVLVGLPPTVSLAKAEPPPKQAPPPAKIDLSDQRSKAQQLEAK